MARATDEGSDGRLVVNGDEVRMRSVIDALPSYVIMVDSDHRIVMANDALYAFTGLKPEDVLGAYCPKLIHGIDGPYEGCPVEDACVSGLSVERDLYDEEHDTWMRSGAYVTDFVTTGNKPIFLHTVADITETKKAQEALLRAHADLEATVKSRTRDLEEANEELHVIARHDALTGLANRRAGMEHLADEFVRMKRTGDTYAVLSMDIDLFKRINDTFGHAVGDESLKKVASVLKGSIRESDFLGRFGGEEFLAILPHTGVEGALRVAESMRKAVAEVPMPLVGQITISIGVAVADTEHPDAEQVVKEADRELYRAKDAGRNKVMCASV